MRRLSELQLQDGANGTKKVLNAKDFWIYPRILFFCYNSLSNSYFVVLKCILHVHHQTLWVCLLNILLYIMVRMYREMYYCIYYSTIVLGYILQYMCTVIGKSFIVYAVVRVYGGREMYYCIQFIVRLYCKREMYYRISYETKKLRTEELKMLR